MVEKIQNRARIISMGNEVLSRGSYVGKFAEMTYQAASKSVLGPCDDLVLNTIVHIDEIGTETGNPDY